MYQCYRTRSPLTIDGRLDEPAWRHAPQSSRFIDVIGGNPGLYDTRAALLWDDDNLYIGFWCEEPFPEAQLTERDDLLWFENDVEVFIDGGDTYYEFQINARNTIYEVFYIWCDAYAPGGRFDTPEFDIFAQAAQTFGGNHDRTGHYFWRGSHPRGLRWTFRNWDFPGLRSAVHIDGKLNDNSVVSKGWTIELAFPWQGMKWLANGRSLPPVDGDIWRLFLGRYERLMLNGEETHVGWAWDAIGTNDNHHPERFTTISFATATVEDLS
jgi:hypothetical protein